MKIKETLIFALLIAIFNVNAQQVAIGTTSPNKSAILELNSTSKGFLPPRMTKAQMNTLNGLSSAVDGLMVFCTDCSPKTIFVRRGGNFLISSLGNPLLTTVVGAGGKIWMDRNLGATRVATSKTDASAYGDYYQFGRTADGHQINNSTTVAATSSTHLISSANIGKFFIGTPKWYTGTTVLWGGASKGVNDPCPIGFRLPTETELTTEQSRWTGDSGTAAFSGLLKLPLAGSRKFSDGALENQGTQGNYWTSTKATSARSLTITASSSFNNSSESSGYSVRCVQN